jgi:hypothetical protein
MNVLQEVYDAFIAKLRTAWGVVGTIFMFTAPLVSLAFQGKVPPEYSAALPYLVLISVAGSLFLIWLVSYAWNAASGRADPFPLPPGETVVYAAYPYNPDYSHLGKFSAFANKVFEGDTMSAEVVRYAVNEKCAVGIGLTDDKGREIGFFDVFRLRKDALQKWLQGNLSEPELKPSDFEPLAQPSEDGKTLELIVGAIYIDDIARADPSLAHQLVDIGLHHLWKACPEWDEIRLYSSIFSEPGERLASLYEFTKTIYKEDRKGAGAKHDVWVRTIRRGDPLLIVRGLGGRRNVKVKVKDP